MFFKNIPTSSIIHITQSGLCSVLPRSVEPVRCLDVLDRRFSKIASPMSYHMEDRYATFGRSWLRFVNSALGASSWLARHEVDRIVEFCVEERKVRIDPVDAGSLPLLAAQLRPCKLSSINISSTPGPRSKRNYSPAREPTRARRVIEFSFRLLGRSFGFEFVLRACFGG